MPTFTRRVKRFPNVELSVETYSLTSGSSLTLDALPSLFAGPGCTDGFLFWNVKSAVHQNPHVVISDVGSQNFSATAWYLHGCEGPDGGTPNVSTAAFNVAADNFFSSTPIASVTPSAAWTVGSTSVDTTGAAVSINAADSMSAIPFSSWSLFGAGSTLGDILSVGHNQSCLAFANYLAESVGPFEPPYFREVVDLFESIRGKIIDWVSDPAPIDLIRITERLRQAEQRNVDRPADALSGVVVDLERLDAAGLKSRLAELKSEASRIDAATKMVNEAIKSRIK